MGLLKDFFRGGRSESVALIDIGASSVVGAYARYSESELPVLLYTRRLPIEIQENEPHERAMFRALELLGTALIIDRIPALVRATGTNGVDAVLVSIDAPWQETKIRVERIMQRKEFVFTKRIVAETLRKMNPAVPGKSISHMSVLGTILNGYEVHDPYGKRVRQATIIILASLIAEKVSSIILSVMQKLYHTKRIFLVAGSAVRSQAMRVAFPHERDAIIVDASGPLVTISLIRKGLLVAVSEALTRASGDKPGAAELMRGLGEIAKEHPLPRTIFMLTRDSEAAALTEVLQSMDTRPFWLSDNPPKIIPVLATHLTSYVRQMTTIAPDLPLLLMAIQYRNTIRAL